MYWNRPISIVWGKEDYVHNARSVHIRIADSARDDAKKYKFGENMNRELYEKLRTLPANADNYLITSLNLENFGAKLLICGSKTEFRSDSWTEEVDFLPGADAADSDVGVRKAELSKSEILSIGEPCRQYFAQKLANEKKVYVCGAGHVSLPIVRLGKMLGFKVTCIEDRPSFADMAKAAGADEIICEEFDLAFREISFDKDSYFVIVTRGHQYDEACLRRILGKPYAYLGMMGSRRRVGMIRDRLIASGFDETEVKNVHAPIGLGIGAQTPEEIAVSIWAEIISVKNESEKGEGFSPKLLEEILKTDEEKVLATIIRRKGSAPRQVGTKMLISKTKTFGTIGGGCAEADAVKAAREMLLFDAADSRIFHINMTEDAAAAEGMVCGGTIDVLMEKL